jgi:signal transduction histidine kinase
MVYADRRRVVQVLRNLYENAMKYGGDQVLIEGSPYGHRYLVVVSDNGPGIQDDDVDRVFGRFEQRSKGDARSDQGIGLGLPIALQLTQAMGGDLWYEHRFPTGSRFCFTVRLATPAGVEFEEVEEPIANA